VVKSKFLKFLFVVLLFFLLALACKDKAEKTSLPKLGTKAVEFNLQDLKGQNWSLDQVRGKVVLLRFWTDWCPHCRYEMPVIENYYRKLNKEGFVVLAVNVKQSVQVVEAFTAQFNITFPILLDLDGKTAQKYGVYAIPTNFLIDRQGVVREICVGKLFKDKDFMKGLLEYFTKNREDLFLLTRGRESLVSAIHFVIRFFDKIKQKGGEKNGSDDTQRKIYEPING